MITLPTFSTTAAQIAALALSSSPNLVLPVFLMEPIAGSVKEYNHRREVDALLLTRSSSPMGSTESSPISYWEEGDGYDVSDEEQNLVDGVGFDQFGWRLGLKDVLGESSGENKDSNWAELLSTEERRNTAKSHEKSNDQKEKESWFSVRPSTYGEITSLGARQLFHQMEMTSVSDEYIGDINFYDLGSGAGKLVVQSYLELKNVRQAVGVELSQQRHDIAVRAWDNLMRDGTAHKIRSQLLHLPTTLEDHNDNAILKLIQGDLFSIDVSDATHIYVSSLCFTDEMMSRLASKLNSEAPRLQHVATLRRFPVEFPLIGITIPVSTTIEMSWTKARGEGCTVYYYSRVGI